MPNWSTDPNATTDDIVACMKLLRGGSRSFHAASFLLPRSARRSACALYAFCRVADDAVDLPEGPADALAQLRIRVQRAYEGMPWTRPADRAFAAVVALHAIPPELPAALLEGFQWDAEGRRYETLEDLYGYAARVAGTVGAMMSLIMGTRASAAIARACDLGVAMQLTNIARDVGEDARSGRLYLPLVWMRDAGLDPDAWIMRPLPDPRISRIVTRLLQAADELYRRADAGIALLPRSCRPGIRAARTLYAAIGDEVLRCGGDSVTSRAYVGAARKAALLVRTLCTMPPPVEGETAPLSQTRFLVDAVATHDASRPNPAPQGIRPSRAEWLVDLVERLERRDHAERACSS